MKRTLAEAGLLLSSAFRRSGRPARLSSPRSLLRRLLTPAAAILSFFTLSAPSHATWSILIVNTRTGEVALASATCLTSFDLRDNTPVLITGVGGATAQSFVDNLGTNRSFIRDALLRGTHPQDIITALSTFDPTHQTRQYGIVDIHNGVGRAATFTGTGAGQHASGIIGSVGDLVYAVQGNVLTNATVVQNAVAAIHNTPGDIAAKLMASMEAARERGGDGRCSCPGGNPPCNTPPTFLKTAHIAYMLIARAGDTDRCIGIYNTGLASDAVAIADLNKDGSPDLATNVTTLPQVSILLHADDEPFIRFDQPVFVNIDEPATDVFLADIDADLQPELLTLTSSQDRLWLYPGLGGASFGPGTSFPVGDFPEFIHSADLNHDTYADAIVTNRDSRTVSVLLGTPEGSLTPAVHSPVGDPAAPPAAVTTALINNDAHPDLVVTARRAADSTIEIYLNDGFGAFTHHASIPAGNNAASIVAADFNNDKLTDLATTNTTDRLIRVLLNNGDGTYTASTFPTGSNPAFLRAADIDHDGHTDLAAGNQAARTLTVLFGNPAKPDLFDDPYTPSTRFTISDIELADLDDDGDADLVLPIFGSRTTHIFENITGRAFEQGIGCAAGDYFMNFNIAFQQPSDPDPVFQLQALYDQWRGELIGRPDAVASTATFDPDALFADGESASTLTITLRDWQELPVTANINSLLISHAPDSAGSSTIGPVKQLSPSTFAATITAGKLTGADRFTITADDGVRPVTLMPTPQIQLLCLGDWDRNGVVNIADAGAFITAYFADRAAGTFETDLNNDGVVNEVDVGVYLTRYFATLNTCD